MRALVEPGTELGKPSQPINRASFIGEAGRIVKCRDPRAKLARLPYNLGMILLLDNYDSFVFNLARYFQRLGQVTRVERSDKIDVAGVRARAPHAIVLSPGPCTPREAGCSLAVVRELHAEIPILGVCLGHQAIGAALGGRVERAREPVHGRASDIVHEDSPLFAGVSNPTRVCRYHSLALDPASLPAALRVTAWADDGEVMAIEHRKFPVVGVQFHPESILTADGYTMLANFLRMAGLPTPGSLPTNEADLDERSSVYEPPIGPVTF